MLGVSLMSAAASIRTTGVWRTGAHIRSPPPPRAVARTTRRARQRDSLEEAADSGDRFPRSIEHRDRADDLARSLPTLITIASVLATDETTLRDAVRTTPTREEITRAWNDS